MGDNDPTGNEPAFPIHGGTNEYQFCGMSLRDHFAAQAMAGAFSSPIPASSEDKEYIAIHAYRMADAMLKARIKSNE